MWSKFLNFYYSNEMKDWVKENIYYKGDHSKADMENDWRFKEVPGKRHQLVFLGLVKDEDFNS